MSTTSPGSHVDVHVDKKARLRSVLLADMPEEILIGIFAHVDAIQVARIQLVSRQWSRIIRSTPTVWRNALHLDYGLKEMSLPTLSFRLCKLADLSEQKLDRVGICFKAIEPCDWRFRSHLSYVESMAHWLFAALRTISVRMLYIFFEEINRDDGLLDYHESVYRELDQLSHADFESLVICYEHSTDTYDAEEMEEEQHHKSLLDAVGLSNDVKNRLYLDRVAFSGVLKPYSKIYANLTGLHLESLRYEDEEDARALWTLLAAMQDTLHELFLSLTPSDIPFKRALGGESDSMTTLTFPKLIRFHLGCLKKICLDEPLGLQLYKFSCPLLESLSVNCTALHGLFDDLLTSTVKYVRVTCRTLAYEENLKALKNSGSLHKLFIDARTSFNSDDQRRVIRAALQVAPQEVILVFDLFTTKANIASFIKLVEDTYPLPPKAPKVGFCNAIRDYALRQAHLDNFRKSISTADQYVWEKDVRPFFAMFERSLGPYDVREEL